MSEFETYCARQVKNYDYDRFLITLFAPSHAREHLFSLYAFNYEVAKIRQSVSEPMLGEIRLQWWREAIEGIYDGKPRQHEVVLALDKAIDQCNLPKDLFLKIIDGRCADIYDENPKTLEQFEQYLGTTAGNLMDLGAKILGQDDQHILSLAYDMGLVWGLIGTIRAIRYHVSLNKLSLPQDLMDQYGVTKRDVFSLKEDENIKNLIKTLCDAADQHLKQIAADKKYLNKDVRSLFLLSSLSRSYLKSLKKTDYNPYIINEKAGIFARQSRLFFSALLGLL